MCRKLFRQVTTIEVCRHQCKLLKSQSIYSLCKNSGLSYVNMDPDLYYACMNVVHVYVTKYNNFVQIYVANIGVKRSMSYHMWEMYAFL